MDRMNISFINEINSFYRWQETNKLGPNEIALWFALMQVSNATGWKRTFSIDNGTLARKAGFIPLYTLRRARKKLQVLGRIDFTPRKNCPTEYRIIPFNQPVTFPVTSTVTIPVTSPVTIHTSDAASGRAVSGDSDFYSVTSPATFPVTSPVTFPVTNPRLEETRKEENIKAAAARAKDKPFSDVFKAYQDNVHPITGPIEQDGLRDLLDTYGEKWVLAGIEEAAKNNGRSLKYISAILKRWEREGFKTDRKKPGGGIPMVRSAPNKADEENLATILSIIGE